MEPDRSLTPVINRFGKFRTPTWVHTAEGLYSACVGVGMYRYFTEATLPTEMKSLLAMVKAFPSGEGTIYSKVSTDMMRYIPPRPEQEDIGWHLGGDAYILILDKKLFSEVCRGRYTREESQEESHRDAEG